MSSESDPVALPHATAEHTRDSESEAHTIPTANTSAPRRPSSHAEPEPRSNTDMPRRQDPALATELNTSHDRSSQDHSDSASLDTDSPSSEPVKTVLQSPSTDGAMSPTGQPDSCYTTSIHPLANGVSLTESKNQIVQPSSLVPSNPVKRGPGRPPRSLMTKPTNPDRPSIQESTRPRRTLRAVTSPTSGGSSVMQAQPREDDRGFSAVSPMQTRTIGQRTSTRHIRTPAKYSDTVATSTTPRATPANQKSLVNRQPSPPEPVVKRGPGRPVSNPHAQHRAAKSPPSPPSSTVVPVKRGPGRPPRNPLNQLAVKPVPQVETSQPSKTKSKSASPTMARSSNGLKASPTSPRSAASTPGGIQATIKRGPGRPRRSDSTSSPSSPSSWRYPHETQIMAPSPNTSSPRSLKRHHKSDVDEDEAVDNLESGLTPRKKRVMSLTDRPLSPLKEKEEAPRILTPLDKARAVMVAEWEGKLHEVIDHHDSLARELYHLETAQNTLTYDPVKIKADHNEKMLRVSLSPVLLPFVSFILLVDTDYVCLTINLFIFCQ